MRRLPCALAAALLVPVLAGAGRGGPDAGGWSWADSNEPGIDTTTEATISQGPITPAYGDEAIYTVNLSFPFTLYGTTSSTVWLSTNGWLSLVDPGGATAPTGAPIPAAGAPDALVAFYWRDLDGIATSFAYQGPTPNGHKVIIRAREKATFATVEAVIQFYRNGTLKVVWLQVPAFPFASIGIEDGAGVAGTGLHFGATPAAGFQLAANYAVLFYPAQTPDCASAVPLACSGAASDTTVGGAARVGGWGCSGLTYPGRERVYAVSTTETQSFSATLSNLGTRDLDLFLVAAGCDSWLDCIAGGGDTINRPMLAPGTYYLVVDGKTTGDDGPFTLTTTCGPFGAAIDCGQNDVPNSPGPNFIDSYTCGLTGSYPQAEAYYRFTAPGPLAMTATPTDAASWDLAVFRAADLPSACFASSPAGITLLNAAAGDYVFVLDARTPPSSAPGLSLACAPFTTEPLPCDATVAGRTATVSQLDVYPCLAGLHGGGEAMFAFQNPVPQDLAFGLSAVPPGVDLDVAVLDAATVFEAGKPPCAAGGDVVVRVANAAAGPYVIVVDGAAGAGDVPFRLSAACGSSALSCGSVPDLSCSSRLPDDSTGAPSAAFLYGADQTIYNGPERVYHFFNPARQAVSFQLRNPSDPRLDLLLLGACDTGALVAREDSELIVPALDAGDYWLVVDGREEAAGSFELVTFCADAELVPPVLVQALDPGTCFTESKTLYFPPYIADADVVLSIDLSASMADELARLQADFAGFAASLAGRVPSLALGLASFVEYEQCYTDTVCGRSSCPTTSGAYAFRVEEPVTTDLARVEAVLQGLAPVGGGKETYTRSLHESYADPGVGWRECARRVWVSAGDEVPVDCNVYACIGGSRAEGRDPGPDLVTGTADDLELLPTVEAMARSGIALLPLDSSESLEQAAMWDCLAGRTGGRASRTDAFGAPLPGSDLAGEVVRAVAVGVRTCPDLRLVATGPDAGWARVSPATVRDASTPWIGSFDVTFCVPPGTPPGSHDIAIEARCLGRGVCAPTWLATQSVRIEVNQACSEAPAAAAGPDLALCQFDPATLDGSGSSAGSCGGAALYEWRNGATVVRPASPTPIFSPPTTTVGTITYTLVVSCPSLPGCSGEDDVAVAVRACSLAVRFGSIEAVAGPRGEGPVLLTWTTLEETDTLGFAIERAAEPAGPWARIGTAAARGPGAYAFRDPEGRAGAWYRLREQTSQGPGDLSPQVQASAPHRGGAPGAGGRSRATRRPRG